MQQRARLQAQRGLRVDVAGPIEQPLRESHRDRSLAGKLGSQLAGRFEYGIGRQRGVREPHRLGFLSVEHQAEHDEFLSLGVADPLGERVGRAAADERAQPDLRQAKLCVLGDDDEVARQSQLEARSDGVPVHGGHDRFGDRLQQPMDALASIDVALPLVEAQLPLPPLPVRLEVGAHTEGATATCDH